MALKKGSILWVDDEIDLLKSQIMFLEERGYKVKPASNGEDAVGLVEEETFDLVLLDQMMPGMDGLTTLVKIKDIAPSLPVGRSVATQICPSSPPGLGTAPAMVCPPRSTSVVCSKMGSWVSSRALLDRST